VVVTEADIGRGEAAVASLDDILGDFAVVLLEIACSASSPRDKDLLPRALGMVVEKYLEAGDIDGLALVVDRLHELERQGRTPAEFAADVFGRAATSGRLTQLITGTSGASPDEVKKTEAVLRKMRNWIMPGLLEIVAESDDKGVRKTVLDLLDSEGGVPVEHLWPLMQDPRWYVVRNAVGLATGSGDPHLIDHLEPLTRHEDARVRREVIRSLDTLSGPRPVVLFVRALSDDDTAVRVLAANGLSRHGNRASVPSLEAQIESRDFATRPSEEINAVLLAYATLGGEATIDVLNRMWKRKMFGTKPMSVRLGAVQALGAVNSPSAHDALVEATRSNEAQIQRTAARTLAEARARMTGDRA
jgi:HEAT repeat protein